MKIHLYLVKHLFLNKSQNAVWKIITIIIEDCELWNTEENILDLHYRKKIDFLTVFTVFKDIDIVDTFTLRVL